MLCPFIPLEDKEIEGEKNPLETGLIKIVLWKSLQVSFKHGRRKDREEIQFKSPDSYDV